MSERDSVEARKSELRKYLFGSKRTRRGNIDHDGKLYYSGIFSWKRKPHEMRLPRAADVAIISYKQPKENDEHLISLGEDGVTLTVQQYDYLLELIRIRISHMEAQPGSLSRINILEERAFAVDLICTLDI